MPASAVEALRSSVSLGMDVRRELELDGHAAAAGPACGESSRACCPRSPPRQARSSSLAPPLRDGGVAPRLRSRLLRPHGKVDRRPDPRHGTSSSGTGESSEPRFWPMVTYASWLPTPRSTWRAQSSNCPASMFNSAVRPNRLRRLLGTLVRHVEQQPVACTRPEVARGGRAESLLARRRAPPPSDPPRTRRLPPTRQCPRRPEGRRRATWPRARSTSSSDGAHTRSIHDASTPSSRSPRRTGPAPRSCLHPSGTSRRTRCR